MRPLHSLFSNTPSFPWLILCFTLLPLTFQLGCSSGPSVDDDPSSAKTEPVRWPSQNGYSNHREGCSNLSGEAFPGSSITFALTDSVNPGLAPIPHNPSERLVFAHLYETLVNVDCEGNLKPGLASAWSCTEDSTLWVFTIRRGARFWDGTHVTSKDVREAWTSNQGCPQRGDQTPLWTWFNARAKTITLVDETRLAIRLPEPQARCPLLLAHPATAVSVRRQGWTWPVGSGPARLRASSPAPMPDLECQPNPHHPQNPIWKSLTFQVLPQTDLRDLVATDIDLALTRNLDEVSFFREMPGFRSEPLPWSRLYLLVCPPEKNPAGMSLWAGLSKKLNATEDLTRVSARPWADIVFPAGGPNICPQLTGPVTMDNSARREWDLGGASLNENTLAYPLGDPAAKELAQRLVALGPLGLRAVGIHPESLNFVLSWQMTGAMILPSDQHFPTGCLQMATLLGRAAWLQTAAFQSDPLVTSDQAENLVQAEAQTRYRHPTPALTLQRNGLVHPLALTRSWLVTRGQWSGLELAFDGTPLLCNLGRPRQGGDLP